MPARHGFVHVPVLWCAYEGFRIEHLFRYRDVVGFAAWQVQRTRAMAQIQLALTDRRTKYCGRKPTQTLVDGKEAWRDKITTLHN